MLNKETTTSSSSTIPPAKKYFPVWIITWWPVLLLLIIFFGAGISKYIYPNTTAYLVFNDIIKSTSVLLLLIYVIYTRALSLETKKMAEASLAQYKSEIGMVMGELVESNCEYNKLLTDVKNITKDIHCCEKQMSEPEFQNIIGKQNLFCIVLKIKNMSARRVEAKQISYSVRHTGSDNKHEVNCDITSIGTILPWEDKPVPLIASDLSPLI